jgi:lipoprotein-anchoring transpeptidase ErfK/SrfK
MVTVSGVARWRVATGAALLALLAAGSQVVVASVPQSVTAPVEIAAPPVPAAPEPDVSVTPAGTVNPAKPVVVHVANGRALRVSVTDAKTGTAVGGMLTPDGTTWTSVGPLAYASTYSVAVDTSSSVTPDAAATTGHQDLTVTTVTPGKTAYPSFVPPPATTSVGVGQPIVVKFDHAVKDRAAAVAALHVTATPAQVGAWYWLSGTEVHYRPQTYWTAGSTITLTADVFGVDLGSGVWGATSRTETIHVHDAWVAKADGRAEQMKIYDNGALVKTMPISLGSPGNPSHIGPHVISDKQPTITMDSCTYGVCPGQPGYYKEQVDLDERISNDGEFVHSAPWSVGSQGGQNVSHGCVNLSPANAQWFFDHFGVGDVVEIANSGGPPLPLSDTYGDWELSWAQWQRGGA